MDKHTKKKDAYQKRMEYIFSHKTMCRLLHVINEILTDLVFVMYPILLVWLLRNDSAKLVRAVIVPMDAFIIVSVFRFIVNRKRPYEAYETPSAVHKDTKGKSFPSRHVFSIYMIAMTYFFCAPSNIWGIILFGLGVILAVIRVTIGVHYISDVIAGAIMGIIAGIIGYICVF